MRRRAAAPATPPRMGDQIADDALAKALARRTAAATPLNNARLEAKAERWLRDLLQSDTFMEFPHDGPATSKPKKPTKLTKRTKRTKRTPSRTRG